MKNQAPSTITFQYPTGRTETLVNDAIALPEILSRLLQSQSSRQVRECLEDHVAFHGDDPDESELAMVWHPELLIDRNGCFYRSSPENGLQKLPFEYSENRRPHVKLNGWTYWAHVETYKAFIGDYNSQTHVVQPKDGNPANCCVSNLMLVKKPHRFRQQDLAE